MSQQPKTNSDVRKSDAFTSIFKNSNGNSFEINSCTINTLLFSALDMKALITIFCLLAVGLSYGAQIPAFGFGDYYNKTILRNHGECLNISMIELKFDFFFL